jgi:DNA repair exonuclease SbcCD ATPase subunit
VILRRLRLTQYRRFTDREFRFEPGLNLVVGPNEAGKSTLVEAIERGLRWNSSARGGKDLNAIVPLGTAAEPTIELDFSLGTTEVRVVKTLAVQSNRRNCTLAISTAGKPERRYSRADGADEELANLLRTPAGDLILSVSAQGEHHAWLGDPKTELPQPALAALARSLEGSILPDDRLERVLITVSGVVDEQLDRRWREGPLRAKGDSPLRRRQKELADLDAEIVRLDGDVHRMTELRARLEELDRAAGAADPELSRRRAEIEALRERRLRQESRGRQRAEVFQKLSATRAELEAMEQRRQRLERLAAEIDELDRRITEATGSLDALLVERNRLGERDAEQRAREASTQAALEEATRRRDGLKLLAERQRVEEKLAELITRRGNIAEAESAIARLETARGGIKSFPRGGVIRALREDHLELERLEAEARSQLRIDFDLKRNAKVRWAADGGPTIAAGAAFFGAAESAQATRTIVVEIEGVGRFTVSSGSREAAEMAAAITERSTKLRRALAEHDVDTGDISAAFAELERRRHDGQEIDNDLEAAQTRIRDELTNFDTVKALDDRIAAGRRRAEELAARTPDRSGPTLESAELDRLIAAAEASIREHGSERDAQQRRLDALREERHQSEKRERELIASRSAWEQAVAGRRADRAKLLEVEPDDRTRDERRGELGLAAARLKAELDDHDKALAGLGAAVSESMVNEAAKALASADERLSAMKVEEAGHRARLEQIADGDPRAALEEARERRIPLLAARDTAERELAGAVLLEATLEARRRRRTRGIAEPLHRLLDRWLGAVRRDPTRVVLDEDQRRISHLEVRGPDGARLHPFAELSEGMKEQLALMVRLAFARLLADQGEPPVLILDDPLTETDLARRSILREMLSEVAEKVQVIVVTCHGEGLESWAGAVHRIDLA